MTLMSMCVTKEEESCDLCEVWRKEKGESGEFFIGKSDVRCEKEAKNRQTPDSARHTLYALRKHLLTSKYNCDTPCTFTQIECISFPTKIEKNRHQIIQIMLLALFKRLILEFTILMKHRQKMNEFFTTSDISLDLSI